MPVPVDNLSPQPAPRTEGAASDSASSGGRGRNRRARLAGAGAAFALLGCMALGSLGCAGSGDVETGAAPQAEQSADGDGAASADSSEAEPTSAAGAIRQAALKQNAAQAQRQAQAVKQAIEAVTAPYGEAVSVTYLPVGEPDGIASVNGSTQHASASMIKLLVLAALLDKVDAGEVDMSSQVEVSAADIVSGTGTVQDDGPGTYELRELARRMIADSDNTATNVIVDLIGMDAVNEEATKLGLTGTVMARKMMDTTAAEQGMRNRMTSDDAATILNLIATGKLVNQQMSDIAMDFLLQQTIDAGLTDAIPSDVSVAHKTGELLGAEHDGGIVLAAKPYVLVVMTEGIDNVAGVSVIADVSRAVYVATNGSDGVSDTNQTAQGVQSAIEAAGGAQWAFDFDEPGVPFTPGDYSYDAGWDASGDEGGDGAGGGDTGGATTPGASAGTDAGTPSTPSGDQAGAGDNGGQAGGDGTGSGSGSGGENGGEGGGSEEVVPSPSQPDTPSGGDTGDGGGSDAGSDGTGDGGGSSDAGDGGAGETGEE